ncbi:MAG TPA: winged helix-turn-helix domain-containing protein [Vicinamibacterales bacterium]|nr:winged helix-turn-helix domain-containing protein [Vicinamibacterales bacterium]
MPHITFGPFRLDTASRRMHRGVDVVPLRPKTFAVLEYLIARPGRLVTKEQLLAAVWPDTAVTDTVLKVCVRELRDALGDDPDSPRFIETAHRLGYRFIAHVQPSTLPAAVSSLIGRQREMEEIARELERSRLVALVGAGGSGKSRLAIEVAGSLRDQYADGVWWVDLAPISDDRFMPQAVATALGLRDQPGQSLTLLLGRFLAMRDTLLVLDNCEHVIAATASLLHTILPLAARLRVLVTSREPLRIDGERVWLVPPLSCPAGDASTARDALEYDAIKLFEDRARAAASFTLSDTNCAGVVEICRRLDGLPLAIELAAARVAALSVEQIATRLDDCFRVLGTGRRTELQRHHTLRAAIDWSYDLLTADERRLLRRLSVFVDRFTLEAAERIAAGPGDGDTNVLDVISRLIDKSLVFVSDRETPGQWRYRLLETVRQYAHEKLVEAEEVPDLLVRHADYHAQLAEATEPHINTPDRPRWLALLDDAHSDLRAAMERSLRGGEFRRATRLASALFWYWFHRGLWREGRTFLHSAIEHESSANDWRARVLLGDGVLAWAEGDQATAAARLEECATIGRTVEDATCTAHALHFLAMVRVAEGHAAAGRPLAEEAVRLARTTNDRFCLTIALASHGVLLLALNEHEPARTVLEESVERGREVGDAWAVALPLRNLGIIAHRRGEYDRARRLLEASLRGLRGLDEKWFLSRSIETLAEVLAWQGANQRAARLFGAAENLRDAVGAPVLAFYRADYDEAVSRARTALGARMFDQCWQEGRALTPDAAIACALGESIGSD